MPVCDLALGHLHEPTLISRLGLQPIRNHFQKKSGSCFVLLFLAIKALTRRTRSASLCVVKDFFGFLAVAGESVLFARLEGGGNGGFPLVPLRELPTLVGQRVSQSADSALRDVNFGRLVGDTFNFT